MRYSLQILGVILGVSGVVQAGCPGGRCPGSHPPQRARVNVQYHSAPRAVVRAAPQAYTWVWVTDAPAVQYAPPVYSQAPVVQYVQPAPSFGFSYSKGGRSFGVGSGGAFYRSGGGCPNCPH